MVTSMHPPVLTDRCMLTQTKCACSGLRRRTPSLQQWRTAMRRQSGCTLILSTWAPLLASLLWVVTAQVSVRFHDCL